MAGRFLGVAVTLCVAGLYAQVAGAPPGVATDVAIPAGMSPDVAALAFDAVACAVRLGDVQAPPSLTVIDYSKPSTARRLWVFDLASRALLFEEFVAHGQGSGDDRATTFSNAPESRQSSLGLFRAAETYVGKHGYSLRLDGLDRGFNDLARARAIVVHGASYVSEGFIAATGRLGRSWGCPAIGVGIARTLIDRVKGGGLVFAYYPDPHWLRTSKYLRRCASRA
jgi:hypothetical protein